MLALYRVGMAKQSIARKLRRDNATVHHGLRRAEALAQATGMVACITDHDQVVAAAGQRSREFAGKEISRELDRVISDREMRCFHSGERGKISLVENQKENAGAVIVQPIICDGDAIGSVSLIGKGNGEKFGNPEKMLVQTAAGFLGRQMES